METVVSILGPTACRSRLPSLPSVEDRPEEWAVLVLGRDGTISRMALWDS